MSIWDTASAAIDAAFAVPGGVTYTGAGIALDGPIAAIREDGTAPELMDAPNAQVAFEIAMADLPRRPRKGDEIGEGSTGWRVIDVRPRHAVRKWLAIVERAP